MGDEVMSEQESTEVEVAEENPVAPELLPADHPLVKTLAAQKDQIKELKAHKARLDEIEAANMSELEKAVARADAAEALVAKRDQADAVRKMAEDVAEAKGVSVSVLRGDTREELEAHADSILAFIPPKPKAATDGSGGNRGDDIDSSVNDINERIAAAEKARNFPLAITLKSRRAAALKH